MRLYTLWFSILFLFSLPALQALTFSVSPSVQTVASGQNFSVEVQVADFSGLTAYQFSMSWDPAVLQLQSVSTFSLPGMSAANFNTFGGTAGQLTTAYYSLTGLPISLPDGSSLFTLNFLATGAAGSSSLISFTSTPTPVAAYDGSFQPVPVSFETGLVNIAAQAGFSVSGNIHRASGAPVPGVLVDLSGDVSGMDLSNTPGDYGFFNLPASSNLTLTPSKNSDPLECVSVRDLLFLYKHILGLAPLGSPYQMVAADVNGSQSITTFDAVELRKLILGIYTEFPIKPSWQFIPASFIFPNPANPFSPAFPLTATLTNLQADVVEDFIGIKTGDASDCVGDTPGPAFLTLSVPNNTTLNYGQTFSLDISTQGFAGVSGLQFSFEWDPAVLQFDQIVNLNPGLVNLSAAFNTTQAASGKISVCWFDQNISSQSLADGSVLFSLQFTAVGAGSTPVAFVQTPTKFEVTNNMCLPFGLNHNDGSVTVAGAPNNTVELHAPAATACPGQTVCLPVTVANFNNVAAAQFSLGWDPAVLSFQQVQQFGLPGTNMSNFGTAFTGSGALSFAWYNASGTGLALPDGTVLFDVCFTVTGAAGASSALSFTNNPTQIEMTDGDFGNLPVQLNPGAVSVNTCALVQLSAPQLTSCAGEPLCLPVQVTGFQNITSAQIGMSWDPALFSFIDVQNLGLPGLDNGDFNFSATASGQLAVFWSSAGESLPDNAALFEVCLQPLGPNGSSSAFNLGNPVEFTDQGFNQVPAAVINGSAALSPTFSNLACNDLVIFSIAGDCQVTVSADDLLEGMCPGMSTVTIKQIPPGTVIATGTGVVRFDATAYIGQTLYYEVTEITSGNKCWGNIQVQGSGCCCGSQADFNNHVTQGFSQLRQQCGIAVTPNALTACQQVTYTWGDGTSSGPFPGNTPAAHLYADPGFYSVCAQVQEVNAAGQVCFETDSCWAVCVTCDTCSNPFIERQWSQASGNSFNIGGNNSNFYISANAAGEYFTTGGFLGAYQGMTAAAGGAHDGFVVKYHNNGLPDWAFGFGDSGDEIGTVVKTDPAGNIFLTGIFNSPSFSMPSPGLGTAPVTLTNHSSEEDVFVAKFDANRNLQWAFSLGNIWGDHVEDLDVDKDGNIVITGLFRATVDFDPLFTHTTKTSNFDLNFYVAKYASADGHLMWVKDLNDSGGAFPLGVSTDPATGDVYATGHFSGSPDFSGDAVPDIVHNGTGPNAVAPFIVKFDAGGNYQWAIALQDAPKTSTGAGWDIEAGAGGVYVAGSYGNVPGINFDPVGNDPTFVLNGQGNFLARYNSAGQAQNVQTLPAGVEVQELSLGIDGRVYLTGSRYAHRMYAGIFDQNCQLVKSVEPFGPQCALSWSVAPDPFGNFAIIGRMAGPDFDADPDANNGPEHSSDGTCNNGVSNNLSDIFVGQYTCACAEPGVSPCGTLCDSITAILTPDTSQSGCCYVLQLDNQVPDTFAYINLCVLSGGTLQTPVTASAGWSVQGFTATNAYLVPDAGMVGVGLSGVAHFCLKDIDAPTQVIEIKYYDAQGIVVCDDTITLECTACVQAIVDSVYCDGWRTYKADICIKAGEGLDYLANSVTLVPLGGAVFNNNVFSLPNLAPGDTFCTLTVAVSNVTPGQTVCFYAILHDQDVAAGEPDLNCCADTIPVCFPIPACDPCDSAVTYATAEPVIVPGDSCCWKITLHNPPAYITGVGTELTTPGVEFSAINNFAGSGWLLNTAAPYSQNNVWWTPIAPQGGFVQDGYMLPPVCIDELSPGSGSSPQEIVVRWLGQDSTVCQQSLSVDCLPEHYECVRVDSAVALCAASGTLDVTLVITNVTMPPVDAGYIELIPVGTSPFTCTPSAFYVNLPAGASTTLQTSVSGATGGELLFLITLHQLNDDSAHLNCCSLTDTLRLHISDETPPTCTPPFNVTVNCESFDPTLAAYGTATGTDDCCFDTLLTDNIFTRFDTVCSKGTIVRRFTALDCAGNSATCAHRIIVIHNNNYYVKFPDDLYTTTCDGSGNYGAPVFYGEDCELLAASYEDVLAPVVPDACFKIERTWTIVNWCTYNPNQGCTTVPNPNPNGTPNHPANLPGPVVSAPGTTVPGWAPTVVAISPGVTPTNFSTFWSTTVNCYRYTQTIKIIDIDPPQLAACPASPQTICDNSGNDPALWNEPYWTDPVHNTNDLCEAAVNLELPATDQCVGADLVFSYVLFLDLDADGILETAVPSANLPGYNNIQFGNAGNPGYSGGTSRAFDERPVGATEKWGFGLLVDPPVAASRTARVRWFNQLGQNTVPQLPHGTHKIKWIVADNCGNESYCEYTFTVNDCAPPAISCINGLSVNIPQQNSVTVWATDFVSNVFDNCTPAGQLTLGIRRAGTGSGFPTGQENIVFGCNDLGIQPVEVWVMDKAGNADFCSTFVIVQDNSGNCPTQSPGNFSFQVFQNQPNPWTGETRIPVFLPEAMSATLRIFDAMGRQAYVDTQAFEQGLQYFTVGNGALPAAGALYYQVETSAGSVRKMMIKE